MSDPFYQSSAWRAVRAKVLAKWKREGRPCGYCGAGLTWKKGEQIVDHIENRRRRPDLALDMRNLQVVHHACNTRKAAYVENGDKPEVGSDGFPVGSDWS